MACARTSFPLLTWSPLKHTVGSTTLEPHCGVIHYSKGFGRDEFVGTLISVMLLLRYINFQQNKISELGVVIIFQQLECCLVVSTGARKYCLGG